MASVEAAEVVVVSAVAVHQVVVPAAADGHSLIEAHEVEGPRFKKMVHG